MYQKPFIKSHNTMHKQSFFLSLLCFLLSVASLSAETLAFPTAEGYGRYATGGRGGQVYYVTRLDDCSDDDLVEGTLRWALRAGDDTPRTVLFRVCGTIYLTSKLKFAHPNVTIAGQTAPGGGVCIAGANIYVCKPNVIIRYIRFRAGDIPATSYPCLDVENTHHVIIDHCSFTWSMEECLTMYDTDSTTLQWSIIGEGLYNSKNAKGARAYATQWGGEHATMHHCLITNCHNRTPRFNGVRSEANIARGSHDHDAFVDNEFLNNVIFNWGKKNSLYGGENDTTKNRDESGVCVGYDRVYLVNNYFRCGPTTQAIGLSTRYFVQGSRVGDYGQWLLSGNEFETGNKFNRTDKACWQDSVLRLVNKDNLYGYVENNANRAFNLDGAQAGEANYNRYVLALPVVESGIVAEPAAEAYSKVTTMAGATLPRMDEEDTRLLAEAAGKQDPQFVGATQKNWLGIIDSQNDIRFAREDCFYVGDSVVGNYPFLDAVEGDSLALDSDLDGLPDLYELAIGLDPTNPQDAAQIATIQPSIEADSNQQDAASASSVPNSSIESTNLETNSPAETSGYTYLEIYLNGVADGTIDKTQYETGAYISQEPDKPLSIDQTTAPHPSSRSTTDPNNPLFNQPYTLLGQPIDTLSVSAPSLLYIHRGTLHYNNH